MTGPDDASRPGVAVASRSEVPRAWTIGLVLAAAAVLAPFAGWIILAIWLGRFARGGHLRLARRLGDRPHLSALVVVLAMTLVLVPLGAVGTVLVMDAVALVTRLAGSDQAHSLLTTLVSDSGASSQATLGELLATQGERAFSLVRVIFSSAAQLLIGLVILFSGVYAMLVDGDRWYAWAEEHAPAGPTVVGRFAGAFVETGRGLAFGMVGAGVLQALLATAAYLVLGVPQALPLGLLTLVFSIVPLVGTAIVWVPVAIGLALTGRLGEGLGLAGFGVLVIGSIDNLARPWLTRYGKLQLPTFVVLVAMFGAVELVGGWGILFGPLIVRLAKEALIVRREAVQAQT